MIFGFPTWMTGRVVGPPVEMENTGTGAGWGTTIILVLDRLGLDASAVSRCRCLAAM